MTRMEPPRAEAKLRHAKQRTSQSELFAGPDTYGSKFYLSLRDRYLERSKVKVFELLRRQESVSYDTLWETALANPLVFESDLKSWLRADRNITLQNLGTDKAPKVGENHFVSRTR